MQSSGFKFDLQHARGLARAGMISTPHGQVPTPIFMPVGTAASVKSLSCADLQAVNAAIILSNTYHLYLRPGMEILEKLGGVHQLMNWSGPILTDSGGFQVFSLGKQSVRKSGQSLSKVSDDGVEFTSHLDGSKHFFSPEKAIEIQQTIGADIIMSFDECSADDAGSEELAVSLRRTHHWAERGLEYHRSHHSLSKYGKYQALFGIVQGGRNQSLRTQSAQFLSSLDFDGMAVGGESIGYNMPATIEIMGWIEKYLPVEKPRYAMGLGRDPQDIIDAVLAGFDMFDCVGPTRLARNGALYSGRVEFGSTRPSFVSEHPAGRLAIGSSCFAEDVQPIDPNCHCPTCTQGYSRAYLHHLYRSKELAYYRFASMHNLFFMINLSRQLREWILNGNA